MIVDNCASCDAWDQIERSYLGICQRLATRTEAPGGEVRVSYPYKRGTSLCPKHRPSRDVAEVLRRQSDVRREMTAPAA